jgi:hypothetical protein
MRKMIYGIILTLSLALVFLARAPIVRPVSGDLLVNGDFETGALNGWYVGGVCSVSTSTVHTGSYSAYISDSTFDNWIQQALNLPADQDYHLEGWIYPLRVGSLGPIAFPHSSLELDYYNRSTMTLSLQESYSWCWNELAYNGTTPGGLYVVNFQLNFNASSWNPLSTNVTQDVRNYFTALNYSELALHDIRWVYHYSDDDPGAFYLDDLALSIPILPQVALVSVQPTAPYPFVPSSKVRQGEPFIVTANATDAGSGISFVMVSYSNNVTSQGEWSNTTMAYNATTGLWSTLLPGQPGGATVTLFFTAWDKFGNQATSSTVLFFVQTLAPGDLNGNGVVDLSDLVILANHYGEHSP